MQRRKFSREFKSPAKRTPEDAAALSAIRQSFTASGRTYGARRVWRGVLAEGFSFGLNRIERLMRQNALKARPRRRYLPADNGERMVSAIAPNVLDRQFHALVPNAKWIADFTPDHVRGRLYIWTAEGWLYVAAEQTQCPVASFRPGQPIHQRAVPAAPGRQRRLLLNEPAGQRLGSSHRGAIGASPMARAAMDSFFSSLKTERTARKVYGTRTEAKAGVFDYIERFYNPRRHSTLGYISPVEFERKAGLA